MSEVFPGKNPEHFTTTPEVETPPQRESEKGSEAAPDVFNVEAIKQSIDKTAISREQTSVGEKNTDQPSQFLLTRDLKAETFRRTLTRTRKKLALPDRLASKVLHQPVVDAVSNLGSKTVARPVSLLTGAFCAFASSLVLLLMARKYGFEYNYLFFTLVFLGGYLVGLVLELIFKLLRRAKA